MVIGMIEPVHPVHWVIRSLPTATVYYSLTYVDVPEDVVGLTWNLRRRDRGCFRPDWDRTPAGLIRNG